MKDLTHTHKTELQQKDIEIREKDKLIKSLKDDDDKEEDDGDCSTEESDSEEKSIKARDNKRKIIGAGHFCKTFEARKGMEEEAE